jgi:Mg2+ and Co2+ transporter CorA
MILTGVTTLALPISAVTGYFGMNFSDMTELSPGNGRLYGVQMFWYALLGLLVLGFLLAWRFRVLAVIQASFR